MRCAILLSLLAACAAAQQPDVGPFPKVAPERAFHELKIYGADGSPLRQPREDWKGARSRVARDKAWADWLKQQQAETDAWMATRKDKVEWVAGWWHDFVSPKDGSFLTFTPDEPGPETLASPSDLKVRLTPKLHAAWVFGFRSRHTEKVWEAARLYRLTGDRKYLDWTAAQLDFYSENYLKWPLQTEKSKARLMHQSLDDANVLIRLANAARLIDAEVAPERRRKWIGQLFRPEAQLLDETMQRIHNIACWQRSAMAQTALYARDKELWARAIDGPFGIRKQIEHGVTSEYLWFEQSFGYNSYVVSALAPLFLMAALEGRQSELRHEMLVIENMLLAPVLLRFPNGQIPNPADATGGLPRVPDTRFLASVYRIFPTALGLAHAATLRTWDTLVDPPEPVAEVPPLPEVRSQPLPTSQMAVIRKGDWQVYFHYGQIHASHAQAEALNFEAFYRNTDITHDPGTVGYGSPLHRNFYRTGAAHNVPLIGGEGQDRWRPGELLHFAGDRVRARQPVYRPGVSATRELRIDGKALVDTLTLELAPGANQTRLGSVLHLQGKIEVPAAAAPVEPSLPYWTATRKLDCRGRVVLKARFGEQLLQVTLETSGPFTLILGNSPDVPPGRRDSIYVETSGTRAVFQTTIEPI